MDFRYAHRRLWESAAQRSVVMSRGGMVATSHPLASMAGWRAMTRGGNAVDAAVAATAVLNVVEPHSVGIGGDAFCLLYLARQGRLVGMNASGRAPKKADPSWFHNRGITEMPQRGILSVTVPGALLGWADLLERYGRLTLGDVLQDAVLLAQRGFPVTEVISGEWRNAQDILMENEEASRVYLPGGRAPMPGKLFANPDLVRSLMIISRDGPQALYEGELADAIVRCSQRLGGLLTKDDLKSHKTTWVDPISTQYRGYTVFELPPNGQGITALQMLNILEGYDLASLGPNHPQYLHLLVEAKKIAFSDREAALCDPEFEAIPMDIWLSKDYARSCRESIDPQRAMNPPKSLLPAWGSDTVYVAAMDEERNAVSLISSIFMHFGSAVVVDGTGIVLQNRGHGFSLDPSHPNCVRPGKRPRHTIIPGMLFKDGNLLMTFGVMGGDMQPQGHVQFLVNLIDFGMNLQEAVDFPRVRHLEGLEVYLEDGIPAKAISELESMGHRIFRGDVPVNMVGGGQAIYLDREQDVLLGASDRRKDGCAVGF